MKINSADVTAPRGFRRWLPTTEQPARPLLVTHEQAEELAFGHYRAGIMKQQGFTLIELMIVVAIIGILAAIAIPLYTNYTARAQASEAFTITANIRTRMIEYMNQNSKCPTSGANGFPDVSSISGSYVSAVSVGGTYPSSGLGDACSVSAKFSASNVTKGLAGGTVKQTAVIHGGGSISWQCSSNDINNRYLPTICRS